MTNSELFACWYLKSFNFLFRPQYGGKFCPGSSRVYQLCNINPCDKNSLDFRAQQCAEYNSKPFRGWFYQWKPYMKVEGNLVSMNLKQIYLHVNSNVNEQHRKNCCLNKRVSAFTFHSPGPSWPRFSFSSVGLFIFPHFFFHKTSLASHMYKLKRSCVWNVLMFLNLLLTFQRLSLPGMLIAIGMNCPDQKLMKPYLPHGDTILSN